jgi:hypothetical protein
MNARKRSHSGSVGVVEDALGLVAGKTLRACLDQEWSRGILTWRVAGSGEIVATAGYRLGEDAGGLIIRLVYAIGGEAIDRAIRITRTHPHLGGVRHWFVCPGCNGRVGKLYLPPTCPLFLCRRCHNLTYESSRSSRRWDAVAHRLGFDRTGVNRFFRAAQRDRLRAERPIGPVPTALPEEAPDAPSFMASTSTPEAPR